MQLEFLYLFHCGTPCWIEKVPSMISENTVWDLGFSQYFPDFPYLNGRTKGASQEQNILSRVSASFPLCIVVSIWTFASKNVLAHISAQTYHQLIGFIFSEYLNFLFSLFLHFKLQIGVLGFIKIYLFYQITHFYKLYFKFFFIKPNNNKRNRPLN